MAIWRMVVWGWLMYTPGLLGHRLDLDLDLANSCPRVLRCCPDSWHMATSPDITGSPPELRIRKFGKKIWWNLILYDFCMILYGFYTLLYFFIWFLYDFWYNYCYEFIIEITIILASWIKNHYFLHGFLYLIITKPYKK